MAVQMCFSGAIGQGADQFSGSLENIEVNHLIRKITGLSAEGYHMKHTLKTIPYMMLLLTASISSSALYAADTTVTPTKSVIFFLGDGMDQPQ